MNLSFDLTVLLGNEAENLSTDEVMKWAEQIAFENDVSWDYFSSKSRRSVVTA